jgi:hypothetical protein
VNREVQISCDDVVRACEIEPVLSGAHPVGIEAGEGDCPMLASRSTLRQTTAEYCTCKSRNEIECEADKTGLRPGETVPQVNVNGDYVSRNIRNRHRPKVITRRR